MKPKSRIFRHPLILALLCALLCAGCSDDRAVVRIFDLADPSESGGDTVLVTPAFGLRISEFDTVPTRSASDASGTVPADPGAVVHLLVYPAGSTPDENRCFYRGLYRTGKYGNLVPVYNDIRLPEGEYDLYMLSVCDSTADLIPSFDPLTGISDYVYNGIDYVWGKRERIRIDRNDTDTIPFTLAHSCVRMEFEFVSPSGDTVTAATLSAPTPSEVSWAVTTGLMDPALTHADSLPLPLSGNRSYAIVLPLQTEEELPLRYSTLRHPDPRVVLLPAPPGGLFRPGGICSYTVTVPDEEERHP